MSKVELADAIAKLETLSESRAKRVVSLIEDLTELEALENTADLKAARDALAESEEPLPMGAGKGGVGARLNVLAREAGKCASAHRSLVLSPKLARSVSFDSKRPALC